MKFPVKHFYQTFVPVIFFSTLAFSAVFAAEEKPS